MTIPEEDEGRIFTIIVVFNTLYTYMYPYICIILGKLGTNFISACINIWSKQNGYETNISGYSPAKKHNIFVLFNSVSAVIMPQKIGKP